MPVPVSATDAGLTTRTDRFAALSSHSRTAPYPRSQSFFCGIRQQQLKENWKAVEKHCTAVVHGSPAGKSGTFASYLAENADQFVYSTPDAGDAKYGRKGDRIARLALHARTLAFPHSHDGRPLVFEAPVPAAILDLVDFPQPERMGAGEPGAKVLARPS